MAHINLIMDDGVTEWDEYNFETYSVQTLVHEAPVEDDRNWEVAGAPRLNRANAIVAEKQAPAKWCRAGNACPWLNCKFRHERCSHFDNWVARGKKGFNCRCHVTDPESKKMPIEGGCKYDHRDPATLKMFVETLPCSTERELWDSFYDKGLRLHVSDVFNIRRMSKSGQLLLMRSLDAAGIEYVDERKYMYIYYTDDTHYPIDDE